MHYGRAFSSRPLLCGSSQCNVRLKGWTIPNLIFLNVFKKGEFLFLNECNTVRHFPAHLPLLCGSSQCFPPQETSTYVSRKDSSLDTSGEKGWKHFLDLFTMAPRLNWKRLILHFGQRRGGGGETKQQRVASPLHTFLCTRTTSILKFETHRSSKCSLQWSSPAESRKRSQTLNQQFAREVRSGLMASSDWCVGLLCLPRPPLPSSCREPPAPPPTPSHPPPALPRYGREMRTFFAHLGLFSRGSETIFSIY